MSSSIMCILLLISNVLFMSMLLIVLVKLYRFADELLISEKKYGNKMERYYSLMNQWLKEKNNNILIENYFKKKKYKKVGIYGYSEIAKRLLEEMKEKSFIEIQGIIDRNYKNISSEYRICGIEEFDLDIDVLIVTPLYEMQEIVQEVRKYVKCDIISIEDIIYNV